MARPFVAGFMLGAAVMLMTSAAIGLHAQSVSDDVASAAVAANVDPVKLAGAVNSVGVDPYTYLRAEGNLPPLPKETAAPPKPTVTVWDRLVQCEASGNWHANTGNGFAGGLQFTVGTWRAYGGVGSPAQASREAQIAVAERVLVGQGWKAWPNCSRALGLR